MKDLHWFIVLGLIMITPLLPYIIRSRCPGCSKRKLQSIDTLKLREDGVEDKYTFVSFWRCDRCAAMFKKVKSGALEASSEEEFQISQQAAVSPMEQISK